MDVNYVWVDGEGVQQGPAPLAHVVAWRDQGYFTNALQMHVEGVASPAWQSLASVLGEPEVEASSSSDSSSSSGSGSDSDSESSDSDDDGSSSSDSSDSEDGEVPAGWVASIDSGSGATFYFAASTGESTWVRPTAPAVTVAAAPPVPPAQADAEGDAAAAAIAAVSLVEVTTAKATAQVKKKKKKKMQLATKKAEKKKATKGARDAKAAASSSSNASWQKKKKKKTTKVLKVGGGASSSSSSSSKSSITKGKAVKKKKKKKTGGASESKLKEAVVSGVGSGGCDEMRARFTSDGIFMGMLRFEVGAGTFRRTKMLWVEFIGETCPPMKRAKATGMRNALKPLCAPCAVDMVMGEPSECDVEVILSRFATVFGADDGESSMSVTDLKKQYKRMCAATKAKGAVMGGGSKRKTVQELIAAGHDITAKKALSAVRDSMGPFNWATFVPHKKDLVLHNAGSLSVDEMCDHLPADDIVAGLIRLSCGSGAMRRSKWVSLWWCGADVSAMKRGKSRATASVTLERLGPVSVAVEAQTVDECSLLAILDKLNRAVQSDHGGKKKKKGGGEFSLDSFLEALKEEAAASSDFFGASSGGIGGSGGGKKKKVGVDKAIESMRNGTANWLLFEPPSKKKK